MEVKYICGWCGAPCEEDGTPWTTIPKDFQPNSDIHTMVHGLCCAESEMMEHEQMVQVTREMALDAGMPEIEGSWIKW